MQDFEKLFKEIAGLKVAIVGDVMLDTYWWGKVERISPEAPVPIVTIEEKEYRLGGAGNVALNTVSLGADTTIFSVIGDDDNAVVLTALLEENKINTSYIIRSSDRITTNKTRVISRNQQMMRLDTEITTDIPETAETNLLQRFETYIKNEKPAVVIFEDYNKGVLTESLVLKAIAICKEYGIVTAVDPKRKNFFAYKEADIFKPNLKEVKDGLNVLLDDITISSLNDIHSKLNEVLRHKISLITLSEKGLFIQDGQFSKIIPTHIRNIADVSGAGDTVIAVASLVYAASKNMLLAAEMANLAGGLVCEEVGTAAIKKEKLLGECKLVLSQIIQLIRKP
jgi:rfaE bifunctional protein kinase chain/domain